MSAVLEDRDSMLRTMAQHVVEGNYHYKGLEELQTLLSNKIGHIVNDPKELKLVEKHIKEIRSGA